MALERTAPLESGEVPLGRMLPILVDEIAPEEELKLANPLAPKESEILRHAASGCRQTIALPPSLVATLAALPAGARPELVATRIWFEHARGRLVLHIGDVEAGRLDE